MQPRVKIKVEEDLYSSPLRYDMFFQNQSRCLNLNHHHNPTTFESFVDTKPVISPSVSTALYPISTAIAPVSSLSRETPPPLSAATIFSLNLESYNNTTTEDGNRQNTEVIDSNHINISTSSTPTSSSISSSLASPSLLPSSLSRPSCTFISSKAITKTIQKKSKKKSVPNNTTKNFCLITISHTGTIAKIQQRPSRLCDEQRQLVKKYKQTKAEICHLNKIADTFRCKERSETETAKNIAWKIDSKKNEKKILRQRIAIFKKNSAL